MSLILKNKFRIFCLSLVVALILPPALLAQDDEKPTFPLETIYAKRKKNTTRAILRNFKFTFSTGVGTTYMNHKLDSFGIFQRTSFSPGIFPKDSSTTSRYSNWINEVTADTVTMIPDSFLVTGDTSKIGFKGKGFNIPINVTLHYEFLKRFRIGGGYTYEPMWLRTFNPISFQDRISSFKPNNSFGWMQKYYGMAGASFYRIDKFLFTGDLHIGGFKPGKNFARELIEKGIYVNLGVSIEYEFSEYLRGLIRPSYDFKKYTLTIPGNVNTIEHKMNALYVQVGLTYSLPELPRCYLHDCKIQMNHAHGNKEYRSRVHPFFKKQNPNYGENHPNLIKYKGKNKRKLNPY